MLAGLADIIIKCEEKLFLAGLKLNFQKYSELSEFDSSTRWTLAHTICHLFLRLGAGVQFSILILEAGEGRHGSKVSQSDI